MTRDLDPKDQDEWLEWMQHFGWHKPTANDLIPTPKPEPTPDTIEYK